MARPLAPRGHEHVVLAQHAQPLRVASRWEYSLRRASAGLQIDPRDVSRFEWGHQRSTVRRQRPAKGGGHLAGQLCQWAANARLWIKLGEAEEGVVVRGEHAPRRMRRTA